MGDWVVLIMWFTSLLVTAWGQYWYTRAKRLIDTVQYMIEEEIELKTDPEEDSE